jgi:hypothetical protein
VDEEFDGHEIQIRTCGRKTGAWRALKGQGLEALVLRTRSKMDSSPMNGHGGEDRAGWVDSVERE